uniref:MADF domain-containing protein n=1 Tax=Sparus aurata TaxID=8175 RepID=A0A671YJ80_SPAAU
LAEKLIVAVCGHPVLYDTTAVFYRNRYKKEEAWVKVAEEVGLPVEVCRKKWKGLRDTYLKKKREGEKRSGSAGGNLRKWRFSAVLSFLDPFTTPRETSGNMGQGVEEDWTAETSYEESLGDEAAAGPSELWSGEAGPSSGPLEERFLSSLAPSLHRLPPQQREFVKFQIHKLIYENTFVTVNLDILE